MLRLLSPHIRRAVMIADLLNARALERDMLSAALDRLAVGIVLTDAEGRIAHTNEAADRTFDDGSILRRVGDQLAARDFNAARELTQAIADAASGTTVDIRVPASSFRSRATPGVIWRLGSSRSIAVYAASLLPALPRASPSSSASWATPRRFRPSCSCAATPSRPPSSAS